VYRNRWNEAISFISEVWYTLTKQVI
jgi:hypothetical protein